MDGKAGIGIALLLAAGGVAPAPLARRRGRRWCGGWWRWERGIWFGSSAHQVGRAGAAGAGGAGEGAGGAGGRAAGGSRRPTGGRSRRSCGRRPCGARRRAGGARPRAAAGLGAGDPAVEPGGAAVAAAAGRRRQPGAGLGRSGARAVLVARGRRPAAASVLLVQGGADLKNANWITRRLAARHPHAEPAMAVAAAYVLLRALALRGRARAPRPPRAARWPRAPPRAPDPAELERPAAGGGAGRGGWRRWPARRRAGGLVQSRPDGRLRSVAAGAAGAPAADAAAGGRWPSRPLAGAARLERDRGRAPGPPRLAAIWEVDCALAVRRLRRAVVGAHGGRRSGPPPGAATGGAR